MNSWNTEETITMTEDSDKGKVPVNMKDIDSAHGHVSIDAALSFAPTPVQARILDIAQAIMEDHYTLDTERLHKSCIRMIKDYDVAAIDAALSDLYYKHVLIEGKAVTKLSLMENPNRQAMYRLIKERPGINAPRLQQELGLSFGTISWHLKMLVKFKLVRVEIINDSLTCFDMSTDKVHDAVYVILQKRQVPEILGLFISRGALRHADLLATLSIPKTSLLRKLRELELYGLITRGGTENGEIILSLAPTFIPIVQRFVH